MRALRGHLRSMIRPGFDMHVRHRRPLIMNPSQVQKAAMFVGQRDEYLFLDCAP